MSRPRTMEFDLEIAGGTASRDGLYVCGRCHAVVHPSQREIDLAESMPSSRVQLKCPACHHWTVEWHQPTPERPRQPAPVSQERGRALFLQVRQALGTLPHC